MGGKGRSIYENNVPTLKDRICQVIGKRVVKTGTYRHGYSGYDYWGEYDFEPAYLENEKTNIILKVYDLDGPVNINNVLQYEFEIHQQHVVKLGKCSLDEMLIGNYE